MIRLLLLVWTCVGCDAVWLDKTRSEDYDNDGQKSEAADGTDCNDFDENIGRDVDEVCDGIDNDCDGEIDDADSDLVLAASDPTFFKDRDEDGFGDAETSGQFCALPPEYADNDLDCDDLDPDLGAPATWYPDDDGDSFGDTTNRGLAACVEPDEDWVPNNGDCDDEDPSINPGVMEGNCEDAGGEGAQDFNCDGQTGFLDNDGDGFAACEDCNDTDPAVNSNAEEVCDGIDNDCNGIPDDDALDALEWFADQDGDGLIDVGSATRECHWYPNWRHTGDLDCDDLDATILGPLPWYADQDADGFGVESDAVLSCTELEGRVQNNQDCDDSNAGINPGMSEECGTTEDLNCDGSVGHIDGDGDGFDACEECDDTNAAVHPNASEVCDGIDNDCSGAPDDDAINSRDWYRDTDGDGQGSLQEVVSACAAPLGTVGNSLDCDDDNATRYSGAPELCDTLDNDCDGDVPVEEQDNDGDGYVDCPKDPGLTDWPDSAINGGDDCDDSDSSSYLGAAELCDGLDNNCDSFLSSEEEDTDGDGYVECTLDSGGWQGSAINGGDDCNDTNSDVNAGAEELCSTGFDDDCDGDINEESATDVGTWYQDSDQDGYGNISVVQPGCTKPSGYTASDQDCDDTDQWINPSVAEVCDPGNVDENCNGFADDLDTGVTDRTDWYPDSDGDGYGDKGGTSVPACDQPSGYVSDNTDCDDGDATSYPGAEEACDTVDNDCDGFADDLDPEGVNGGTTTYYADSDGDSFGDANSSAEFCNYPASGYTTDNTDCNDNDGSAWQLLNRDEDGDGYCASTTVVCVSLAAPYSNTCDPANLDCDDTQSLVNPGAAEDCTWTNGTTGLGIDDDCDGLIDNDYNQGDSFEGWLDSDGDGYGTGVPVVFCIVPTGYVLADGDCDDTNALVSPDAAEICDGVDNDCQNGIDGSTATDALTWYYDYDGDGYGDPADTLDACSQPTGYVLDDQDCDDLVSTANPGNLTETICNDAADDDCDTLKDCNDGDCSGDSACSSSSSTYSAVAAGPTCYCTLDSSGGNIDCACIGSNSITSGIPTQGAPFSEISVASTAACALDAGGRIECWGDTTNSIPSPPPGAGYTGLSVGDSHACAVDMSSNIVCWGVCAGSHCGTAQGSCASGAHQANQCASTSTGIYTDVAVSGGVTCGVQSDGPQPGSSAMCFGLNTVSGEPHQSAMDQLDFFSLDQSDGCGVAAQGTSYDCWAPIWSQSMMSFSFVEVSCGVSGCCVLLQDETADCWSVGGGVGSNYSGPYGSMGVGQDFACFVRSDTEALECYGTTP